MPLPLAPKPLPFPKRVSIEADKHHLIQHLFGNAAFSGPHPSLQISLWPRTNRPNSPRNDGRAPSDPVRLDRIQKTSRPTAYLSTIRLACSLDAAAHCAALPARRQLVI